MDLTLVNGPTESVEDVATELASIRLLHGARRAPVFVEIDGRLLAVGGVVFVESVGPRGDTPRVPAHVVIRANT